MTLAQKMRPFLSAILCLVIANCSHKQISKSELDPIDFPIPEISDQSVGEWGNIHSKNLGLAGVLVQQFPDCSLEAAAWEGKHPAMILFVMWDGRVNQIGYKPSGMITENFWWHLSSDSHDYSYIWKQVDYTYGSDPKFQRHKDPRRG